MKEGLLDGRVVSLKQRCCCSRGCLVYDPLVFLWALTHHSAVPEADRSTMSTTLAVDSAILLTLFLGAISNEALRMYVVSTCVMTGTEVCDAGILRLCKAAHTTSYGCLILCFRCS